MAKQFGDVVTYQMGKVSVNALVVQSNPQADGEHLTIVYVDPAVASSSMSGMLVDKAIARAFVTPLVEGKAYGWKDTLGEPAEAPDTIHLDPLRYESLLAAEKLVEALTKGHDTQTAELLKVSGELQKANDANQTLRQQLDDFDKLPVPVMGVPSAADLDAAAEEAKAKEATATIKSTSSFSGGHPGVAKPDGGDLGVGTAPIPESKVTNGL